MKRYTSEQINAMTFKEWVEVMADELNKAGYKYIGAGGKQEPFSVLDEPKYFLLGNIDKAEEIDYLKNIGLLNNGRCPMCGNKIIGSPGRFTSGYDLNYHFQVCQNCVQNWKGKRIKSSQNQGCIVAVLLLPWNIIKYFF